MICEIKDDFYVDGKKFQIISGSIHYFRVVPEYWRDRLEKLKNMGCNAVETYIPWNFHEIEKNMFVWDGMHDVCRFIQTAQDVGLYVIIRPSPYICAEYEYGGLPWWLLQDKNMKVRCSYGPYLDAIKNYYSVLMPKLVPYQIDNGGPVILMQIENEYGYYGNDHSYMEFLRDTMRHYGITVPFVTSDGPWGHSMEAGMTEGALATGNFGSKVKEQFAVMTDRLGNNKPLMCMEFWVGWFDSWGDIHHHSDLEQNKVDFDEVIRTGHVNIYMFEGGTNFGFTSGRNWDAKNADVTSYDYDAVLTEDGQITPKYNAFKEIISKYKKIEEIPLSTNIESSDYGEIECCAKVNLSSVLKDISKCTESPYPLSMEELNYGSGYVLYRINLSEGECAEEIQVQDFHDRVQAFCNGKLLFTDTEEHSAEKFIVPEDLRKNGAVLDFLVENYGRVNFGFDLDNQRKGILKGVAVNGHRHFGYEMYSLPLSSKQVSQVDFDGKVPFKETEPSFYKFKFNAGKKADTFIELDGFGKGCVFINGFNIGRFWEIGPQKRLYVPAPLLKNGANEIIVFETEGKAGKTIQLRKSPSLG
ncbi:MAG: beta-galactosidase [Treponema sp.]|nr:beta-galactosidase [Treponema sp.]